MVRDVRKWLEDLGLGKYVETFVANDVGIDVLQDLGESDLERLGLSLGHRKRLLRAIAELEAVPAPVLRPSQEIGESDKPLPIAAERRQLTVMFIDLVGSTALSQRLDPEEMREVMRAYQNAVAGEVVRFEGHVAKLMGDGVLAYFGWPRAHEDGAERAVRSGLAIVTAVAKLATPAKAPLAARVGIATGLVVVGDLVGEGAAQEEAVIGDTPNLAARLQTLAEGGGVIVADATRKLLGELFDLTDLGAHALKGFAQPIQAWRIVGESRAESRFEALHGIRLTPLVGRDPELALLLDRWERAKVGEGQVVLLSGEPGIGKSRIALSLRERLRGEEFVSLRYHGSPYHTDSALVPILDQLHRAAGFAHEDAADIKLAKLEGLLSRAMVATTSAVPLIAEYMAIATGDRYRPPELAPEQKKAKTFQALLAWLESLAAQRPVVMTAEDVHWFDPTSLELFDLFADRIERLPVLMVVTFRPDFAPRWTGRPHVTLLTLNRLGRNEGSALISYLSGGRALPAEVQAQILTKTEGIPLFVEELTKAVLESGLLRDTGARFELMSRQHSLAIPATLQDSLMARLDRVAAVKDVAQIGAVIGREFDYELIAAVAEIEPPKLTAALDELVRSELVFRHGTAPSATYTFKHALVQDAAYESLLKTRRQELHRRIVAAFEARYPTVVESEPELVAHHCALANLDEKAAAYWLKAGHRAADRSSHVEAVRHFKKALQSLDALPDNAERASRELDAVLALGLSLQDIEGAGSSATASAYKRARALSERTGTARQRFAVLWGLWRYHVHREEPEIAGKLAGELASLAEHERSAGLRLQAWHAQWSTADCNGGTLAGTLDLVKSGLELYEPAERRSPIYRLSTHDPGVCGYGAWAEIAWLLGYPDQSQERIDDALRLARQLDHPSTMANALVNAVELYQLRAEAEPLQDSADQLIALATEQGFADYLTRGRFGRGFALVLQGKSEEGLALMREGLSASLAAGRLVYVFYYRAMLAEAYRRAGLHDEARRLGRAEIAAITADPPVYWRAAEVFRLIGESLADCVGDERALSDIWLSEAVDTARRQCAKSLELRAATSLARLWAERGERRRAHDLLAPIHGWFTEGFDTPDLMDAKSLLDTLN